MPETPRHICFVRLSALGDVTLCLPAIRLLRRAFPETEITWVTSPTAHSLLDGLDGVRFLVVDKPRGLGDWWRLRDRFSDRHYDVLLAAQASGRAHVLYPWIKARRRIGFDARRARDLHGLFVRERIPHADEHLLDGFLAFARALGMSADPRPEDFALPLRPADHEAADALLRSLQLPERPTAFAVLHAAASKAERTWNTSGYAKAARHLAIHRGLPVLLTGGPGDKERLLVAEIAAKAASPSVINIAGSTAPRTLAALIARSRLLVAPDTGPVHFARAAGTRVVGLYAVARPALSGPYRQLEYTVDAYPAAAKACGKDPATADWHWRAHRLPDGRSAMDLISVEDVSAAIDAALQSQRSPKSE